MNAEDIFRCSIGCEIMLMIKARIRLIFSRYNSYLCKGKEETHATMLQRRPFTILEEDVIFFCLLPVGVCIDAYVTIRSYVLCVSTH